MYILKDALNPLAFYTFLERTRTQIISQPIFTFHIFELVCSKLQPTAILKLSEITFHIPEVFPVG